MVAIIVRLLGSSRVRWLAVTPVLAAVFLLAACNHGRHRVLEVAYVSAPQAGLRDQVATIFNRVGNVKNGDRVEVLDREKRFARVRTASGLEGWIEQRFLVDQKTFDALQKLTADNQNAPVQAPGILRNETNLHLAPGRETEHLYQLGGRREGGDLAAGDRRKVRRGSAAEAIRAANGVRKILGQGSGRAGTRRLVAGA